ncbi:MAG: LamG-like jellyroll fold domain-containing protein [Micromonosporaceae bacterium]
MGRTRSYFQFNVSGLLGTGVRTAEFNVYETYAPSCGYKRAVVLHGSGPISSSTTWSKQPAIGAELQRHTIAWGYSSSCAARWVGFNAFGEVDGAVRAGSSTATVMLRAGAANDSSSWVENDKYAWKKFRVDVSLVVTYNRKPNVPANLTLAGGACQAVPNQPYIGSSGPTLRATSSDPDGGTVATQFEWYVHGGALRGQTTTPFQASGTPFSVTIASGTCADGETMSVRARAYDGTDWGAWTPWGCHATVDQTPPGVAPLVSSQDYPPGEIGGGVGETGSFQFSPNGVADVAGYYFDLHDQPQRYVAADATGNATALVTPPSEGPTTLWVQSVDRAGNVGPLAAYEFVVGRGAPPVAHWRVDGFDTETGLADGSGNGHHATVSNATMGSTAYWAGGRHDDALHVSEPGHVATAGPVLDTAKTFSVSAWVRLDRLGGRPAVVSQDGTRTAGFQVQATPEGRWSFVMFNADVDGGGGEGRVTSATPVRVGGWTHLVAVRDLAAQQLRLYVDGRPDGTAAYGAAWSAGGRFTMGRSMWLGSPTDYLPGLLDEVRAYQRGLGEQEIRELATTPAVAEGYWPLDELGAGGGGGATDASGNFRNAVPQGGAQPIEAAAVGTGGVLLDGTGWLAASGEAVQTDTSFTVSAYVSMDELTGTAQTAVSQDGPRSSGFRLQYRPETGKWTFAVSRGDADSPQWLAVDSTFDAVAWEWTQLTGVLDLASRELRLYVNGAPAGSTPIPDGVTISRTSGELVMGRAKQAGGHTGFFAGVLDDVRVYTGVRTHDQIQRDYADPPVEQPSVYAGQVSRWVNSRWDHVGSPGRVPRGYHFEGGLGMFAPPGAPDTRMLYSCMNGADEFTSALADCEGQRVIGELGPVYANPPAGVPTQPLYRCNLTSGADHFLSSAADCEGHTTEGLLGYTRDYRHLIRYRQVDQLTGRVASAHGYQLDGSYRPEARLGFAAGWGHAGTVTLMLCRDAEDFFLSDDSACEGKSPLYATAAVWVQPPAEHPSAALNRCRTATGEVFESTDPGCEGHSLVRQLGYVITKLL